MPLRPMYPPQEPRVDDPATLQWKYDVAMVVLWSALALIFFFADHRLRAWVVNLEVAIAFSARLLPFWRLWPKRYRLAAGGVYWTAVVLIDWRSFGLF